MNREPLPARKVHPHVDDITAYICNKYDPLQRDKFENDPAYFAEMLENYVLV